MNTDDTYKITGYSGKRSPRLCKAGWQIYPLLQKEGQAAPTKLQRYRHLGAAGGGESHHPICGEAEVAMHLLIAADPPPSKGGDNAPVVPRLMFSAESWSCA
jgi:hypothetical protein